MPLPHYTVRAIRAAQLAGRKAARAGARKVEPEHLLVAFLGATGLLTTVLDELAIDPAPLRPEVRALAAAGASGRRSKPRLSARMENLLAGAEDQAQSLGERSIDAQHLLLALIAKGGPAADLLARHGATYDLVRQGIRRVLSIRSPSHCPTCGYDLRATPDRCPECGRGF